MMSCERRAPSSEVWLGIVRNAGVSHNLLRAQLEALRIRDPKIYPADPAVDERLDVGERYFQLRGRLFPLRRQRERAATKGVAVDDALVAALLYCEAMSGVLMGVQDASRIEGGLVLRAAADGESFDGMRERVQCRIGEVVLSDDVGIIASVEQGPDRRTAVTKASQEIVWFVFGIEPGGERAARIGVELIVRTMSSASAGTECDV